jgi:hypothetical protein
MRQAGQATQAISHAIVGRWTYPIDGHAGFVREFRRDGTVTVWWPDGKVAGQGTFFVVATNAVGVEYSNKDTDVVLLAESNLIRIAHMQHNGYHFKFVAMREEPAEGNAGLIVAPPRSAH